MAFRITLSIASTQTGPGYISRGDGPILLETNPPHRLEATRCSAAADPPWIPLANINGLDNDNPGNTTLSSAIPPNTPA